MEISEYAKDKILSICNYATNFILYRKDEVSSIDEAARRVKLYIDSTVYDGTDWKMSIREKDFVSMSTYLKEELEQKGEEINKCSFNFSDAELNREPVSEEELKFIVEFSDKICSFFDNYLAYLYDFGRDIDDFNNVYMIMKKDKPTYEELLRMRIIDHGLHEEINTLKEYASELCQKLEENINETNILEIALIGKEAKKELMKLKRRR